jgi:hypothetical protein
MACDGEPAGERRHEGDGDDMGVSSPRYPRRKVPSVEKVLSMADQMRVPGNLL